jgi:hypothetical protein
MDQKHDELYKDYQTTHENVEKFQGTHDLLVHSKVEANKDAIAAHAATIKRISEMLEKMKQKESQAVTVAAAYADQNNPDNTQMYLDAYNEYFDYLASQESVPDAQATAVVDKIDSLETLLKSQKLRTEVEQHQIPVEILQQVKGEQLEQVKRIFVELVTQRIADLKGMIPPDGFKPQELNGFWLQALAELQSANQPEPVESNHPLDPDAVPAATRKIRATWWTGDFKKRRVGGRSSREN